MRKILVIALIGIHMFGNTELAQVFKLPNLISHYFEHSRINPDLNFFEFIAMHYGGDDGTTADDDFDKQLPCHQPDHTTIAVSYSPMLKVVSSIDLFTGETIPYNSRIVTGISSKHVQLILQPPRQA